jgi:hypothetical protein
MALACKSTLSRTALPGSLGSSRVGIRSTINISKGTATICEAFSERLK